MLDLRLELLSDVVDMFVLVEGDRSFRGRPKPLQFDPARYPQIRYVPVTDFPAYPGDPWAYEYFQRRAILRGLEDALPDDRILVSDADEIINPAQLASDDPTPRMYDLDLYYYWLDCRVRNLPAYGPFQVPFYRLIDPALLRKAVCLWHSDVPILKQLACQVIGDWTGTDTNAGWSFCFVESPEAMQQKIRDFSHDELDTAAISDLAYLAECRATLRDLWDRPLGLEQSVVPFAIQGFARRHPELCHRLDTAPTVS